MFKINGTNLQFDTSETCFHFFLHPGKHLIVAAHPNKAIDGNALLAEGKGCVENDRTTGKKIQQGCFNAEKHGRSLFDGRERGLLLGDKRQEG